MITDRQKLDLISYLAEEEYYKDYYERKVVYQKEFSQLIYEIAHPHKSCRHREWEADAEKMYKELIKKKIL